jgi:hypothetical protein
VIEWRYEALVGDCLFGEHVECHRERRSVFCCGDADGVGACQVNTLVCGKFLTLTAKPGSPADRHGGAVEECRRAPIRVLKTQAADRKRVGTPQQRGTSDLLGEADLDGARAPAFGLDWVKLTPGMHEVCFTAVPGYATPPCETAVVVEGATAVVVADFAPLAELRVNTDPPAALPITTDGRTVDQYGFWTWVPGGVTREVCADAHAGQTVTPTAGLLTTVTLLPD